MLLFFYVLLNYITEFYIAERPKKYVYEYDTGITHAIVKGKFYKFWFY